MQKKESRTSYLKNVVPQYLKDRSLNEKLQILENCNQTDDQNQSNLLDDPYIDEMSLSGLDNNPDLDLSKRLSLMMRESGFQKELENTMKSKQSLLVSNTPKMSNNEKLLDQLDKEDESNLLDERLSFARLSFLDLADRNSIVHGPSFNNKRETAERISMKRPSYRKSKYKGVTKTKSNLFYR